MQINNITEQTKKALKTSVHIVFCEKLWVTLLTFMGILLRLESTITLCHFKRQ